MKFSAMKYRTSDALRQAFDWKVDERAPVYSKLSRSKLRATQTVPSEETYINHGGTTYVSEARDNYRPKSALRASTASVSTQERSASLDTTHSRSADTETLLAVSVVLERAANGLKEPEHITIIDQREPAGPKVKKAKVGARSGDRSCPSEELVSRFLPDSAFTRKFNRPLFAHFGRGATEVTHSGLKTHNALSNRQSGRLSGELRPRSAFATLKKAKPAKEELLALITQAEDDKAALRTEPRHWELSQPNVIAKRPSSAQPKIESCPAVVHAPSNARGQSDLFRQGEQRESRLTAFNEHPVKDSYFSHHIIG